MTEEELPVEVLEIDQAFEEQQIQKLHRIKDDRDNGKVRECLDRVGQACVDEENVMEPIIAAVKASATLQEVCDVFRKAFGEYRDPGIY